MQESTVNSKTLQKSSTLSELDLCIVNALQIDPRAPWSAVAKVLDVDPATVLRRWESMRRRGLAWVSARPLRTASRGIALVEIECRSGASAKVAADLSRDPNVRTIDITVGGRDLLVALNCRDMDLLTWYLTKSFAAVPDVTRIRSQLMVTAYTDPRPWRLRSLSAAQVEALSRRLENPPRDDRHYDGHYDRHYDEVDLRIAAALSGDGRLSAPALAEHARISVSTARRRLNRLLASRRIRLRCELARSASGWPVLAWFFARVPSERLDHVGRTLARLPEARLVTSTVGPYNMMFSAWLRSVRHVQDIEAQIVREHPDVQIVDRSIVVHQYKLAGRLLDTRGLSIGVVPLPAPGTGDPVGADAP